MSFRRLFLDIETSPNEGYFWQPGRKVSIDYRAIKKERAIICVCYKWADHKEVQALTWTRGDDAPMLRKLAKVLEQADEIVTHNGDHFDLPHIRTRCLFHGIGIMHGFNSADTLKVARYRYRFNSNRLDYLAKFLGVGGKLQNPPDLWDRVVSGDRQALAEMVEYCKHDVRILEGVHGKLMTFHNAHTHIGVATGGDRLTCPHCGSLRTVSHKTLTTAAGMVKRHMRCKACSKHFNMPEGVYRGTLKMREMFAKKKANEQRGKV